MVQFPLNFFLITPSSSTYLGHHHRQHLQWLDQLAHCQDQLKMTDQQLCINNGHCKQIQPFTCTCSLTHTHSSSLSRLGHKAKINPLNPVLCFDLCFTSCWTHLLQLVHHPSPQAPVAQMLDSAIHWINHYSVDKY